MIKTNTETAKEEDENNHFEKYINCICAMQRVQPKKQKWMFENPWKLMKL